MIGNDIIDLRLAHFDNEQRFERYAKKVCTAKEISQFGKFEKPLHSLWRFWSLKESAFKAAVRKGSASQFSPKAYEVKLINAQKSLVSFNTDVFKGFTEVGEHFIHSYVTSDGKRVQLNTVFSGQNLRRRLTLKFDGRLPCIFLDGSGWQMASLSHHGQFQSIIHPL